ncbi:uroporphyrinogen-III synthase [Arenibacter nanhaiticus]|nr:uroporphyrinogen-III synthase [Arenibacter nanhaiticus]
MSVLSTKKLSASQKELLGHAQIPVVDYDAITITFKDFTIDQQCPNLIFTSQNTVNAYLGQRALSPHSQNALPKAFCVGEKTKALLEENGLEVVEMTHYGKELAQILVEKYKSESFLLLCGNKRRHEIPNALAQHHIAFKEVQLYNNTPNPVAFKDNFKAVLFFSPSGVQSYTAANAIKESIAICIGTTTAEEAQKHSKHIVIAAKPTLESVLEKAIETLTAKRIN